mmetsp:Transcript_4396/g.14213  ORF Transcript_4396/g.14213 Transcript_4396/m.14213 type:complete len:103 (-) Transcript_4396:155-463(-)
MLLAAAEGQLGPDGLNVAADAAAGAARAAEKARMSRAQAEVMLRALEVEAWAVAKDIFGEGGAAGPAPSEKLRRAHKVRERMGELHRALLEMRMQEAGGRRV